MAAGAQFDLPAGAARHVQVLRLQPGDAITLFNGAAAHGQWQAQIVKWAAAMCKCAWWRTRRWSANTAARCELLAGITANEHMDWLVEKATELGAASLTPLLAERSVLKLKGRARREKTRPLAGRGRGRLRAVRAQPGAGDSPGGHAGAVAGRPPAAAA